MSSTFIIVPVYNGEKYIRTFIANVDSKLLKKFVFVNDGSTDETVDILKKNNMHVLHHAVNRGKGAAIKTALRWIKDNNGSSAITIDIDLQHPLELIDQFSQIPDGKILIGYRTQRRVMPFLRQCSNFITSLLISVRSGQVIKDSQCGYRSFHVGIFDQINCIENGFHFESEFLIKSSIIGQRVEHISIPAIYNDQPSAMKHMKDTYKFIKMWFISFFWI